MQLNGFKAAIGSNTDSAFPRICGLKHITWLSAFFLFVTYGWGWFKLQNGHIFTTTSLLSASDVLFTSVH